MGMIHHIRTQAPLRKYHQVVGASWILRCPRYIWYAYHNAYPQPKKSPAIQQIMKQGKNQEPIFASLCRKKGWTTATNPIEAAASGMVAGIWPSSRQICLASPRYPEYLAGMCDSIVQGWDPSNPKKQAIIEYKYINASKYMYILAHGLRTAKPDYFAQLQMYMYWAGIPDGIFLAGRRAGAGDPLCTCADAYHEHITLDPAYAADIEERTMGIISAGIPPEPAEGYECKYCEYAIPCHEVLGRRTVQPVATCRTCTRYQLGHTADCATHSKMFGCRDMARDVCDAWDCIPQLR